MNIPKTKPQTMVEKILSAKVGRSVFAGEVLTVEIDCAMATDGSAPMAIDFFEQLEGEVKYPDRMLFVLDHYVPCPNDKVAALFKKMELFARDHSIRLYGEGEGICHRLVPERGHVVPGSIVVGADSHSTTYGALNALGTGVGSSDFAGALYTGRVWLRVPKSRKITLEGKLTKGVYAKDAALYMVGALGADGATYSSLEFDGSGVAGLDMDSRFTICNMAVETGAKNGIMPCDEVCRGWIKNNPYLDDAVTFNEVSADTGAEYIAKTNIDLGQLEPQVSVPHSVDNVHPVAEWAEKTVHMAVIGTCTNGSLEDLRITAKVLKEHTLAKGMRLLVIPPSRKILQQAVDEGLMTVFLEKGAMLVPPGCGPCCGAMNGIPRDGEAVISTANRNFKGRMGNVQSEVFLASPLTVIASAIRGKIADPRSFL